MKFILALRNNLSFLFTIRISTIHFIYLTFKNQLMRQLLLSLFLFSGLLTGCNSHKDKITVKDDQGGTATIDMSEMQEAAKKMEANADRASELKKLTPLTLDELKVLLPEELMGMKRSRFNVSSAMGVSVGTGEYRSEDGKEIKLEIIDCAGEMGANWYTMRYFSLWNFQQEDDNGYQKTIDFNGGKAIEKYNKSNDRYELTSFAGDRFIVNVEGEKTGLDAVKQVASSLQLKTK
jgi:hypothetical protein